MKTYGWTGGTIPLVNFSTIHGERSASHFGCSTSFTHIQQSTRTIRKTKHMYNTYIKAHTQYIQQSTC